MKMKTLKHKISPTLSMIGFDLVTLLKKRKKTVIASIIAILMFWLTDEALASIIAGFLIEAVIGIGEFYFKEVELE